jgi:dihydrofolate synthase/folylpolyglutamate synthase
LQWKGREWIFDVAHNVAGAEFVAQRLQQVGAAPVIAIFSAMADKDLAGIFTALAPTVTQWYLFPLQDNPRAASLEQLQAAALHAGVDPLALQICVDAPSAVNMAAEYQPAETVLVCGSFFTVSAIKACIS